MSPLKVRRERPQMQPPATTFCLVFPPRFHCSHEMPSRASSASPGRRRREPRDWWLVLERRTPPFIEPLDGVDWRSRSIGSAGTQVPHSRSRGRLGSTPRPAIRCVTMHDHGGPPSSWHADDALSRMLRWGGLDFVACKECMARQWPIRTRARHPDRTGCAVWTADPSHPYSNPNRTAFEPASSTACTTRWKERSAAVLLCGVRAG